MKLLVPLLLVALALGCYEADAAACTAFVLDSKSFLFDPEPIFKLALEKYEAPPEAVAAKLKVKECTDKIDLGKRTLIAGMLTKMVVECAF